MKTGLILGHFKLKIPQKCITFEPIVRFTKFKSLNWLENLTSAHFSDHFRTIPEIGPNSDQSPIFRTDQRHWIWYLEKKQETCSPSVRTRVNCFFNCRTELKSVKPIPLKMKKICFNFCLRSLKVVFEKLG